MRWKEYKKLKEEWYLKYIHRNKLKKCSACNGSGFYDHSFPHRTVAEKMGIAIEENRLHDSSYDIEITRKIYYLL